MFRGQGSGDGMKKQSQRGLVPARSRCSRTQKLFWCYPLLVASLKVVCFEEYDRQKKKRKKEEGQEEKKKKGLMWDQFKYKQFVEKALLESSPCLGTSAICSPGLGPKGGASVLGLEHKQK